MTNNINMNKSLEKLNKQQLLSIISKMKKVDLINVINQQVGGGNNAIRTEIKFNLNIVMFKTPPPSLISTHIPFLDPH